MYYIYRLEIDKDKYIKKCEDCVELSQIEVYNQPNNPEDDDPNYLHFDHFNEETHGSIKQSWLQQKVCNL